MKKLIVQFELRKNKKCWYICKLTKMSLLLILLLFAAVNKKYLSYLYFLSCERFLFLFFIQNITL